METLTKIIWIAILALVITVVYYTIRFLLKNYNNLTYYELQAEKQFSNIEILLKKKLDLIPALMDIVKDYGKHEKGTLEEVTKMRSQWGSNKNNKEVNVKKANMLEGTLSKLLNIQEKYPELKADKRFQDIQNSISEVEIELVSERKLYNEKVEKYNLKLKLFPNNIANKFLKFEEKEFFTNGGGI